MKIKEYFGSISQLEKKLSAWIDLPISLRVRSTGTRNITFLFESFSEEEIISFFKDTIQQPEHAIVGYRHMEIF